MVTYLLLYAHLLRASIFGEVYVGVLMMHSVVTVLNRLGPSSLLCVVGQLVGQLVNVAATSADTTVYHINSTRSLPVCACPEK